MTTATSTTNRLHPCGLAMEYRNTARSIGSLQHFNREVRVSKPAVRWGAAGWSSTANDRSVDAVGSWGIRRNITAQSSSKRIFVAGYYLGEHLPIDGGASGMGILPMSEGLTQTHGQDARATAGIQMLRQSPDAPITWREAWSAVPRTWPARRRRRWRRPRGRSARSPPPRSRWTR